ncbi:DsbA family protein [Rhodobacteraceae bacterium KMM 6894]|nr:DsbA family protein [Rhodobacteraceae bacterium KMM 6894]
MNAKILIAAAAVTAIGGAAYWTLSGPSASQSTALTSLTPVISTQDSTASTDTASDETAPAIIEMTMGPEDAKVQIVEYASFTCPHCASFHQTALKQLKAEYIDTGKVHFTYRDVYFDRPGLWGAMLARCDGPDRFFGIADMLYKQQREWLSADDALGISNNLRRIGKVAGMDEEKINACLADADKAEALMAWYQANIEADDINSTPTLMINGKQHSNMSFADLKKIIDEKLAE